MRYIILITMILMYFHTHADPTCKNDYYCSIEKDLLSLSSEIDSYIDGISTTNLSESQLNEINFFNEKGRLILDRYYHPSKYSNGDPWESNISIEQLRTKIDVKLKYGPQNKIDSNKAKSASSNVKSSNSAASKNSGNSRGTNGVEQIVANNNAEIEPIYPEAIDHQIDESSNAEGKSYKEEIFTVVAFITLIGIFLGISKHVVFYNDYNDLMLSLGVIAIPVIVGMILSTILSDEITMVFVYGTLAFLFITTLKRTYSANNNSIIIAVLLVISKVTLSILYILHLYVAVTDKNKKSRRVAAFILVILTPLMFALVHDKETSDGGILAKNPFRIW